LDAWRKNQVEGLDVDVEHEYVNVVLDSLRRPVQEAAEEDGRDLVRRSNPSGQHRIKIFGTRMTNAIRRRSRRAQCEDPVRARAVT
jgi:hypothetical protein